MNEIDWIVMTPTERARATVLNDADALLGSRRIVKGERAGQWVVPARLLWDPDYTRWHTLLQPLPRLRALPDALFPTPEPEAGAE